MRWQEEHILLNYEMQWTVRFFLNKSKQWLDCAHIQDISNGAKAYAHRQKTRWERMAFTSDKIFKNVSKIDYISPVTQII